MFKKLRKFRKGFINVLSWLITISVYEKSIAQLKTVNDINIENITERELLNIMKKATKLKKKAKLMFKLADFISQFA